MATSSTSWQRLYGGDTHTIQTHIAHMLTHTHTRAQTYTHKHTHTHTYNSHTLTGIKKTFSGKRRCHQPQGSGDVIMVMRHGGDDCETVGRSGETIGRSGETIGRSERL